MTYTSKDRPLLFHTVMLLAVMVIVSALEANAQVFPVQVNTQLLPPYTPYLSDYTTPGAQKIMTQFRINDPTVAEYRCKLRITIEGVGITLRTKPNFIPQPIVLEGGGIPQLFYGEDLAEYFDPDNMDFAGLSRSEFNKTSQLPEGVYKFSIEVLDYNRSTVVSNKATTIAWIILNDPPILNLPRTDVKVSIQDPTYIPFTWTSRHSASPNSSFSTEYIFRLVEIWPANRNPYDAFLTQPPLFETTVSESQIIYGLTEPALIPGRKYAWQVQARDINGRDLFKNQGRSEVFVFQFGDELGVPENFRKEAANASTISVQWEPSATGEMPLQYRLRYKPVGGSNWYETVTDQRWSTLSQLKSSTEYDVQVRAEKEKQVSEYTTVQRLSTTGADPDKGYTCGQTTTVPLPDSDTALFSLAPGDIFTGYDFKVVVTEIDSANNGMYMGKGMAQVNMFNGASIEVSFSGNINSEYKLTTGKVKSLYERGSSMGQVIDEMHKIGEEQPEPAQESETDSTTLAPDVTYLVTGIIDSVYVNADGEIVVIDQDGNETSYQQPLDSLSGEKETVTITDSEGNAYTVSPDGQVSNTTAASAAGNQSNTTASNATPKEKKLIAEILKRFEDQIASVLNPVREPVFPRGAGPIANDIYEPVPPSCMPEDQDQLKIIKEYLSKISNDEKSLDTFINAVYQNENDKQTIVSIASNTTVADNQKFEDVLSSEDLQKVEQSLCSHAVEEAKNYVAQLWWDAPYWERAAKILKEHLEDVGLYEDVTVECGSTSCKTIGIIKIAEGVTATIEVTFSSSITASATSEILRAHKVDFWDAHSVTLETFKERFWNYMEQKDDNLYEGKGWESETLKIFADVLMAAPGTVEGWITDKHWRTGEELAMWEHILGILDVIPAESLAKVGVTALIIKIGGKVIDISKFTTPVKSFIVNSYKAGLKVLVKSADEVILYAADGVQQIGRLVNGVLQDIYWKYGGERIVLRLAGIKYMVDPTTKKIIDGTLEIVEESGTIGIREADDVWMLTRQTLGRVADSKVLGDNLVAVGKVRQPNNAAHHIVAGSHKNPLAIQTREILKRAGIDINEAINGVFLPLNRLFANPPATTHSILHTDKYFLNVFNRLNNVPQGKVRDELLKITDELLNGSFSF